MAEQSAVVQLIREEAPVVSPQAPSEVPAAPQPTAEPLPKKRAPAKRKRTAGTVKSKGTATKVVLVKSKRKTAVARASARPGSGRIRINGFDINVMGPVEHRRLMLEPIGVSSITRDLASKIDITVNVSGGGSSAQAQAVRSAIAKSIVGFSGSDAVEKEYMHHDRFMVVDDSRRVEPKKFKGPKARARFQKSYR
jgi:small subunit ribosomal protein S9